MQSNNIKIALKGTVKPRSRLGYVVGSVIEVSWEVTNVDSRPFPGGMLTITMVPANGQFVQATYKVDPLLPNGKQVMNKNPNGSPYTTNVLSSGFTLFQAYVANVDIYSPPTEYRDPRTSFLSILGKSKEEVYTLFALIVAAIGLFLTAVIGIIQLLH
ncbi:MAG: hypothetical protein ABSA75_13535 [Candidatus Bathyarchaeia archaeon]|jgi:hypothetical protein